MNIKNPPFQNMLASLGVIAVKYSPETSPTEIIAMADKLLYKAKVNGATG